MNEIDLPKGSAAAPDGAAATPAVAAEAAPAKPTEAAPAGGDEYEAVEGLDRASIECTRIHEAAAAKKTASDYEHIVWAYGVLWSLFAIYGVMLWRRGQRLRSDVDTLRTRLSRP